MCFPQVRDDTESLDPSRGVWDVAESRVPACQERINSDKDEGVGRRVGVLALALVQTTGWGSGHGNENGRKR